MNIRLPFRRDRAIIFVLRAALLSLCALLIAGCGTGPGAANTYTKSVTAADEASAAQTLKTIAGAQASYFASHGEYGSFKDLTGSGMLDSRFNGSPPEMNGYVFTIKLLPSAGGTIPPSSSGNEAKYSVSADPKTPASGIQTAGRHFYLDSTSSVIHVNSTQSASATDPAFP